MTDSRRPLRLPGATLVVGLVITVVLVLLTHGIYQRNEGRLLRLRLRDAGSVVTAALPGIQTPLASAAELADATGGDLGKFERFIAPYVRTARTFQSVSLWKLTDIGGGPVAVIGAAPKLTLSQAPSFFASATHSSTLAVVGLLSGNNPRLGYALAAPGAGQYVAYGETPLPSHRVAPIQRNSTFAGLNYAIYLGRSERPQNLLLSSVPDLPLHGRVATEAVPFGNTKLTVAMSAQASLSGSLPADLPWIIGLAGVLLSLAASSGAMRLTQRRIRAEQLAGELELTAGENRRLYSEQRTIAQTLQHALLPDRLPQVPGVQALARYHAGERSVDIGGDWYDVIALSGERLLLVVGDVSGRGLRAATTMAELRYAIRAYAIQDDPPETILSKLSGLISVVEQGQLATVLCAQVDVARHQITVTSAGHLPPLLVDGDEARYIDSPIGLPIGVQAEATYTSTTVEVPPMATVLAFTDGLVERRGENLDNGLLRLRETAARADSALPALLDQLVEDLSGGHGQDDIAIVGLRWTS